MSQHKNKQFEDFYTLGHKLGQGHFGIIYLCTENATGLKFACKCIPKRKLVSKEACEDVRHEVQVMHHLTGHPNIVAIKGTHKDSTMVYLVMELCEGGELFDRIIKEGTFTEAKAANLMRNIVGAVEACHKSGVVHRDLKPENLLFVSKHEDSILKVIDFGFSRFFEDGEILIQVVGSPYYVAPEVLDRYSGPKADIWSADVILYVMLSGARPYWAETIKELHEEVMKRGSPDFTAHPWPHISEGAKDLLCKMLKLNPRGRYTASEVLEHPWIRQDGMAPQL